MTSKVESILSEMCDLIYYWPIGSRHRLETLAANLRLELRIKKRQRNHANSEAEATE
jgi:hypothetical protein